MNGQADDSRKWRADVAEQLADCSREEVLRIIAGWIEYQVDTVSEAQANWWNETVELHRLRAYERAVANMAEPQLAEVEVPSAS